MQRSCQFRTDCAGSFRTFREHFASWQFELSFELSVSCKTALWLLGLAFFICVQKIFELLGSLRPETLRQSCEVFKFFNRLLGAN